MGRGESKSWSSICRSLLSMFGGCCSSGGGGHDEEYSSYWEDDGGGAGVRRICPSDEDGVRWVGDRQIDTKATAFITKFHDSRISDPDHQFAV